MVTIIRHALPAKSHEFPEKQRVRDSFSLRLRRGVGHHAGRLSPSVTLPPAKPGANLQKLNARLPQCFAASFFGMKPIAKLTAIAPQKSQNDKALGEWKSTR